MRHTFFAGVNDISRKEYDLLEKQQTPPETSADNSLETLTALVEKEKKAIALLLRHRETLKTIISNAEDWDSILAAGKELEKIHPEALQIEYAKHCGKLRFLRKPASTDQKVVSADKLPAPASPGSGNNLTMKKT